MTAAIGSPAFAGASVVEGPAVFGLAVRYVRAEGNTICHRSDDGTGIRVFDGVSGFGSPMSGHDNPEIAEHAKALPDQQVPVHAQMTGYSHGLNVATRLNKIVRRELRPEDKFFALSGNTGAQAVEIAIKHAEPDRGIRIAGLVGEIEAHDEQARAAVADGATLSAAIAREQPVQDEDDALRAVDPPDGRGDRPGGLGLPGRLRDPAERGPQPVRVTGPPGSAGGRHLVPPRQSTISTGLTARPSGAACSASLIPENGNLRSMRSKGNRPSRHDRISCGTNV